MHPDNWQMVIMSDGRVIGYRKDVLPPPEVSHALSQGTARVVQRKGSARQSARKHERRAKP